MSISLKTINPYFQSVWDKEKQFECRFNDRNFQVGDQIKLLEYDPVYDCYSGRTINVRIIYILENFVGLAQGYVVFGFEEISRVDNVTESF